MAAKKTAARKPAAKRASGARKNAGRSGGARGGGARAKTAGDQAAPDPTPFQPGFAPECMACPFGVFFYVVKNQRPDVMEHLMKGGFELFQAFKAMTEQVNDRWESGTSQRMERINIS